MPTVSFYARGDSSTASNPQFNPLNTNQVPTTILTFTSEAEGDILLEYNGGLPDPDTLVIINGVSATFTVVQEGFLPTTGQGSNALRNVNGLDLRGERLVVISVDGVRYFFLPDLNLSLETMNAFPNGGLQLAGVTTGGPPILICFATGTLIATPEGERPVEALRAGDLVLNVEGEAVELRWVGHRHLSPDELSRHPDLRPVRLPAGLFGPGRPHSPLEVSPQHRLLVEGWIVQLSVAHERALIPARHLLGDRVTQTSGESAVTYHHLLFDRHEIVLSNGLPTESLQPARNNIRDIDPAARAEFNLLFPEGIPADLSGRPAAAPSLRVHESRLVVDAMT